MPDAEIDARFDALQRKLVPLWTSIQSITQDPQTIVVVPSITIDSTIRGARQQAYEERFLFLLLLLRQPRARLIYVTSQAIHAEIIDYYLDLLPGVLASHAKKRLFLVSPLDGSSRPLTAEAAGTAAADSAHPRADPGSRPRAPGAVQHHAARARPGAGARHPDVRRGPAGTRISAPRAARAASSPRRACSHPLGIEDLHSRRRPCRAPSSRCAGASRRSRKVVVKLNEGVSGEGNAHLDLDGAGHQWADRRRRSPIGLQAMRFESSEMTSDTYIAKLAERGGIVEERIVGSDFRSPSAQLRVTPLGKVEPLSTHDQVLGGPTRAELSRLPIPGRRRRTGPAIMREALKVGQRLMREGVLGRFALDFVTVRNAQGEWEVYAIEINLRKGGTTHPFLTLQFLTDGAYDPETGVFLTPLGEPKCFVASDHVESPKYRVFTHHDLFDIVARHGLHFDQTRQKGVVFHMMNAIAENGLLGLTAVGNTHEEATAIYDKAVKALDDEADLRQESRR